jgi:glycosyltransferase involved in cell wall biosynthesis
MSPERFANPSKMMLHGDLMSNKVSVALATYNGAKYLLDQLDSFIYQMRLPDELIICDDCSTDETLTIALNFAEVAPFAVKVFSNDRNLGFSQNFSRAIELCSGDYVFLSDQDDVWHPEKIARMLARFDAEPNVQLLIHDLDYCKEDLSPIGQTKIERMAGAFDLQRDYVVGMATAVRISFLRLCLPVPDKQGVAHDTWLHQCAVAVDKKGIMSDVLAQYRRHGSNVSVAGSLNVDFVTSSDHFKDMNSIVNKLRYKTIMDMPYVIPLFEWLQSNKQILIEKGYVTESRIANLINEELHRVDSIKTRSTILAMKRFQRFWPVFRFYRKGGYQYFSGWKSAVKDVLFN